MSDQNEILYRSVMAELSPAGKKRLKRLLLLGAVGASSAGLAYAHHKDPKAFKENVSKIYEGAKGMTKNLKDKFRSKKNGASQDEDYDGVAVAPVQSEVPFNREALARFMKRAEKE